MKGEGSREERTKGKGSCVVGVLKKSSYNAILFRFSSLYHARKRDCSLQYRKRVL